MRCIKLSAAIVGAVLLMQFSAPVIGQIAWVQVHSVYFRSASFAIGCMLAVAQIWVVWLMLVPINEADADVRGVQEAQCSLAGGPQGKKGKRKP
jgi:hypothetical protein